MFANAFKALSSGISANYTISPQPTSTSGPWKIFDAKSKRTGKSVSVFVFERKSLEHQGGALGARSSASSLRRAHEEVLDRLKREASSLARLRHPSILELTEPVEETSKGGLMFVTEAVVSSLAGLLQEKDEQERSGGRASRYVVEESDGTRTRRDLDLDELEIQKGLLQLGKGLAFLHESAGLVHANLTPDAVMINSKGDWKISGLAFCGPHAESTAATSLPPISLHEVLNHDPRLPRSVQLNIDYTSPDFVLDNTLTASADMFSLGLVIVALHNSPRGSPLSTGSSLSSYKRIFASSSTVPTQANNFLVPKSHTLPPKLAELLARLITRRSAQRLSAKEFQEAAYFDNILVSTIRFLDSFPAKTPNEKSAFMRGLPRITPQFPKSVLEKKILPVLLEETKDPDLLAPIIANILTIVKSLPNGKRAFTMTVVPKLREIFIGTKAAEKDTSREAALMILLEHMGTVTQNCSGKEFRDDIMPIIVLALESPTHGLVDAALSTISVVLPSLDFSTIKNELFPVIAQVFAKTSSLNIKVRGLEAFNILCGGTAGEVANEDDINGIGVPDKKRPTASSSVILDKYTVQEKVIPLIKGIKTKEPGVMMAALKVLRQVGEVADTEFLAMDVLPILWSMSLGPLLNLSQFQAFMALIKSLSARIEREQTRKLQELSSNSGSLSDAYKQTPTSTGGPKTVSSTAGDDTDFESLVSGRRQQLDHGDLMSSADHSMTPTFSWQSSAPSSSFAQSSASSLRQPQAPTTRTVTPDLAAFRTLTPSSQYSQPLQPSRQLSSTLPTRPAQQSNGYASGAGSAIDWSGAANSSSASWSNLKSSGQKNTPGYNGTVKSSFSLPPPPVSPQAVGQTYGFPSVQSATRTSQQQQNGSGGPQKSGLDKYESLI